MTDPADQPAWVDRSGDEIGDICADDYIQGRFLGPTGTRVTMPPHGRVTVTFRVTLAAGVPSLGKKPVLDFEAYLDQLNPAMGSGTTLADTEGTDIAVTPVR